MTPPRPAPSAVPRNNIGLLRYLLALAVFVCHANVLVGTPLPVPVRLAVGLFFAMSGYFGWKGARRASTSAAYLLRRGRRLLPPYWASVAFFAVALAAVSSLPPASFFGSAQWACYLAANLLTLNFLQPTLPGVFSGGAAGGAVNGALWFVKVEIALALLTPLLAKTAPRRRPWLSPALAYALCAAVIFLGGNVRLPEEAARYVWYLQMYSGGALCASLNLCSRPSRWLWGAAGAAGWAAYLALPSLEPILAIAPTAAALVGFGCTKSASRLNRNNLSYAFFLVHFPLLQCAAQAQRAGWWQSPWLSAALALAASALLAAALHAVAERGSSKF